MEFVSLISDYILFVTCLFILGGSVFISFKTGFVQIRLLPYLFKMLRKNSKEKENPNLISPNRALFTAMSTTLGIGSIVGPVIAIHLGGPGALIGFLLTSFFGCAATYLEVNLSLLFRKKLPSGEIMGGPMQYLKTLLSPSFAKWYAMAGLLLMMAWSSAQANQLVAILDSPLLGDYRISTMVSGAVIAVLTLIVLIGGIQRISSLSAKLVPVMFTLYVGASLWIVFMNVDRLGEVFGVIISSALSPYAMGTGAVVGGIMSSLRWGIFKGTQVCEAGVGTQAIPHSMAETNDPKAQATLAMLSTYTAGILSFLSGCVSLLTGTWEDPTLPLGISMVAASYHMYFSTLGIVIIAISVFLFAFGTILGNSYNGSQCFGYLTQNRGVFYYYAVTCCMVFLGSIADVKMVWSSIDLVLSIMVIPHMAALVLYAIKDKALIAPEGNVLKEVV